ncbi:hypothetical protein O6H91_08G048600 [Diphasiastrum complanatum]|uniref:Uncharacterized protein n=1 Tax=Diphasiastrum complanatum TaxID=34168 RepID=A0ACC2CXB6_DIPCM|nr:hypothetical protein O6H91_08G048600 [Diphasiastrum complanatum]
MAMSLDRIPHCAAVSNSIPIHSDPLQHAERFRKLSSASLPLFNSREKEALLWSSSRSSAAQGAYFNSAARKSSCVGTAVPVSELTDFADQEALKFREGLIKLLEPVESSHDSRGKMADVCTKIFRSFVLNYSGQLPAEPFGKMRTALDSEGLPGVKAARAALGWARCNLYYDWKKYTKAVS